jgi:hypothetical protein
MATLAPKVIDETWTNIGAVPLVFSVISGDVEVAASTAIPTAGIKGHPYSPGSGDMVSFGPNAWVRCIGGTAELVVTVA